VPRLSGRCFSDSMPRLSAAGGQNFSGVFAVYAHGTNAPSGPYCHARRNNHFLRSGFPLGYQTPRLISHGAYLQGVATEIKSRR
jgi:hypothetical protein